jgi:hypothetical protein
MAIYTTRPTRVTDEMFIEAAHALADQEVFRSDHFADVSLNQWMALTPPELVQAHLNLDAQTMAVLRKDKPVIVASRGDRV